jgi:hypothetical protein
MHIISCLSLSHCFFQTYNLGGFTLESPQEEYWKLLAVFEVKTRNIEKHFRKSYKAWKVNVRVYMCG